MYKKQVPGLLIYSILPFISKNTGKQVALQMAG